ncbi:MAG TPA: beta-L-arabinofuranosidase domain-containing protein [Opitutaceae bacterium]|nr:beta-L-arabinofuranosidase domain-containing protein [Opitutaceae bacterium]
MRSFFRLLFACSFCSSVAALFAADYPVQPVPFTAVRITGGFWQTRQEINRTVTVPFAMQQCEESNRLRNFDLAAETMRRRAAGEKNFQNQPLTIYTFDDTDAYKAIEAASYVLSVQPDAALDRKLDEWIARIAAAQEPDGYLYTFRTMHPDSPAHKWVGEKRWEKDPELSHELYNCGHLYEAGVAHFQATGKRTLLDVCLKNAELLWHDFGDGTLRIAPGHEIVEMGLVKLFRVTGDTRWLKLAQIFLDARGPGGPEYNQRHKLVVDQDTAVGHAVRANYLYSGMADVAALTGDRRYFDAIGKIWDNATSRKMYLTGSVGALARGEAYGADYELPLDGYNETCAAVALMMWNHRMFLLTSDARYMDVFERTAYNGFISGVSVSGDRFFYTNPVAYDGQRKNNSGHAGRVPWFGCACCPPNLMRTLASLTGYFYAVRDDSLYVNFFAQSDGAATVAGTKVKLAQTTDYPWQGAIKIAVTPEKPATFTLRVRIPGWAEGKPVPSDLYVFDDAIAADASGWSARVGGADVKRALDHGYLAITREWRDGDVVELNFAEPVRTVRGSEKIAATRGCVALERGPMVYCLEDVDYAGTLAALTLPADAKLAIESRKLLGGLEVVTIDGARAAGRPLAPLTAIPYFAWNNRGNAPMAVWLKREGGETRATANSPVALAAP